ncbi:hypothetical protein AZF37_05130 [endosymbiont 'TC1' of Trimyema compressum]|uniref:RsmE family RNA methyltransferase n=1 Tax=endosymbiont 'TC1' of Trimyema compressum TaxID=243899 RepID=UPI0007F151A7|nr:RsmE family RNA methyltransferase [endosymbiont 'TC1' of Trimyema compressum]AMP20641.1 hypothetical protein AZF37_05130 [endosymbiont 'TC1' of Trimyema compressum]
MEVIDSENRLFKGRIKDISSNTTLIAEPQVLPSREPDILVTLYQGYPKGDKLELIIQKCVELGVNKIVPFLLTNSVVRIDSKKAKNKKERWQKIALAAVKQCGRNRVPTIEALKTLEDYLKNKNKENSTLVLYEKEGPKFSTLLENLKNQGIKAVDLIVGPEGGLTEEEVNAIQNNGGYSVSLGQRILRTETASIAAVSIVMYELGDLE